MASTYSSLKFELIGTGDQSGTWGTTTNVNLGTAIEEAITGTADVAFSSADVTLTLTDTNGAQVARNLRLNLTGTSGGARNLTVPNIEKYYIIANNLADTVTVKNSTGTTYGIPAGTTAQVFSTGVGITDALSFLNGALLSSVAVITGGSIDNTPIGFTTPSTGKFTTLTASSPIGVASGGTGVTTSTGSGATVLGTSPTLSSPTISSGAVTLSSSGLTFSNSSTQTIGAGMGTGGQTWQSVTGSRAIGTSYTNSTGYPIFVAISGTGGGANGLWGVTLSGAITFYTPSTYTTSVWTSTTFVVPNGGTYQLTQQGSNATLQNWSELR